MTWTRLVLLNFQCHAHLEVELSEVTVLTGSSDRGKSAVVRALYWLAFNEPAGGQFLRRGAKAKDGVEVQLWDDAGGVVTRYRDTKGNGYRLKTPDGQEQTWDKHGRGVPLTVQQYLGLDPINFQRQMDPPFLLSSSNIEVGRLVNSYVRLDVIDRSVRWLNGHLRDLTARHQATTEALGKVTADLTTFPALEGALARLEAMDDLEVELVGGRDCHRRLTSLLDEASRANAQVKSLSWVDDADRRTREVAELVATRSEVAQDARRLANTLVLQNTLKDALAGDDRIIDGATPIVESLDVIASEHRRATDDRRVLASLVQTALSLKSHLAGLDRERQTTEQALKGKACPTCHRPLEVTL